MELHHHDPMNSKEYLSRRAITMNHLVKWPLVFGCLALLLVRAAWAQPSATYVNNAIVTYPGTLGYVPTIDATNFVNNSTFTINFTTLTFFNSTVFETADTINYTNMGSMVANTGFNFDTQSSFDGSRRMAGTFYNPSTISCGAGNSLIFIIYLGIVILISPRQRLMLGRPTSLIQARWMWGWMV